MRLMNIAVSSWTCVCARSCVSPHVCACMYTCVCVYMCMWGVQCCLPHTGVSELGEKGSGLAVKKLWSGMGQHMRKGR